MEELFKTPMTLDQYMLSVERKYVESALRVCRWNEAATARHLGITYRSLRHRLQRFRGWAQSFSPLENKVSWARLRKVVLAHYGHVCQDCGKTPEDGVRIDVDHVKSRERYPWLALEFSNLQVLCDPCNRRKGQSETDFRSHS